VASFGHNGRTANMIYTVYLTVACCLSYRSTKLRLEYNKLHHDNHHIVCISHTKSVLRATTLGPRDILRLEREGFVRVECSDVDNIGYLACSEDKTRRQN
jgi:hypothetical protein